MGNQFCTHKIILASGSPRRQQFLRDLQFDFEIRLKEVAEVYPDHLQGVEITNYLAQLKANAFEGTLEDQEVLLTSDTIVWFENKALGKPKDFEDAFAMLKAMSGKTHEVITSVCFKTNRKTETVFEVTKVTFKNLSDEVIHHYLENYKPFDKAGAYGIQEWIGLIGIAKIEGSYTNVVGMPTDVVFEYLTNL
jgi:septum formation protein